MISDLVGFGTGCYLLCFWLKQLQLKDISGINPMPAGTCNGQCSFVLWNGFTHRWLCKCHQEIN